jgi:tryptophan synthase beta chain
MKQMEMAGENPDILVGCVGGGSNFAGLVFPFLGRKLRGQGNVRALAVEPEACPSITKGKYAYDFGDTAHMTPLIKMHTLGSTFMPPGIHAGGLRYHGMAPLVSHLFKLGVIEAVAYQQTRVFEAAVQFAQTQGIVPAPESAHAVRAAIDEAIQAREEGKKRVILFNLSGHGLLDLTAYEAFYTHKLKDD